jgi:hypothetical protein
LPIFHEIALDVDCLEAWKGFKSTKLLNFQYPMKQQQTIPFVQLGIPASHPVEARLQHNIERLCLLQERGSNNGLTIPGAPSYVKRGERLDDTGWRTFLM